MMKAGSWEAETADGPFGDSQPAWEDPVMFLMLLVCTPDRPYRISELLLLCDMELLASEGNMLK